MWLESAADGGKLAAIEVLRHHNKDATHIFVDKHVRHPRKLAFISIGCAMGFLYAISRMFS